MINIVFTYFRMHVIMEMTIVLPRQFEPTVEIITRVKIHEVHQQQKTGFKI